MRGQMGGVARRRRGRPRGVDELRPGVEARVDRGHQQRWEVHPKLETRTPKLGLRNLKPEPGSRNSEPGTRNLKTGP